MVRPTRFYSSQQEKKVAKAVSGQKTANSGATKFSKGDVVTDKFLLECKTMTSNRKQFTIQKDWLIKNDEEAFAMGKPYSALCFDFGPDSKQRYYVITEGLFKQLQKLLEEGNDE